MNDIVTCDINQTSKTFHFLTFRNNLKPEYSANTELTIDIGTSRIHAVLVKQSHALVRSEYCRKTPRFSDEEHRLFDSPPGTN